MEHDRGFSGSVYPTHYPPSIRGKPTLTNADLPIVDIRLDLLAVLWNFIAADAPAETVRRLSGGAERLREMPIKKSPRPKGALKKGRGSTLRSQL